MREDSLTLYGFATDDEKHVFETVQTVSGVGPRLALAMLAVHSPAAVRVALGSGDLAALMKVPGIGKKGAERLVLELRDKLGRPARRGGGDRPRARRRRRRPGATRSARRSSASAGPSARPTTPSTRWPARADEGASVSALLRAALQELGR